MTKDFDYILNKLKVECDRRRIPRVKRTPNVMKTLLRDFSREEADIIKISQRTKTTDADAIKRYISSNSKHGRYIRYTDYYKQCPEFSKRLSGIPPPIITGSQIDRIVSIFPACMIAYKRSPRYLRKMANREGRKK